MKSKHCLYNITFEYNDTCDFSRVWQDEWYDSYRGKKFVPPPISKHLENLKSGRARGYDILEITGGEPLLFEKLPEFTKEAKGLGFKTILRTNGILYSERKNELKSLFDKIYFSLDYPDEETHNESRGIESFNDVIRGIIDAPRFGALPIIDFTLTRDSVRFMPEMVELATKLNATIEAHPVFDYAGIDGFAKETYDYIKYFFKNPIIFINLAELEFLKSHGNDPKWPKCRASTSTVTFLPDGNEASPCLYNIGGRCGREEVCSGCTRWPYISQSFDHGFDKYKLLNWYSYWRAKGKVLPL